MKLLLFFIATLLSVTALSARVPCHFEQLAAGGLSLRSYLHKKLTPVIYQHTKAAGEATGIEGTMLDRMLEMGGIVTSVLPVSPIAEQLQTMGRPRRVEDPQERELESMLGEMEEFLRDEKASFFASTQEKIFRTVRSGEELSALEAEQALGIDQQLAEMLVQATTLTAKRRMLFEQHLDGSISDQQLIEGNRLLINEYQALIDPDLRLELLAALDLENYPGGI